MSNLKLFLKGNKKQRTNEKYAPTQSLVDENGNALEWEFRHLNSKEVEQIREDNMYEVQVTGKPNLYRTKSNPKKIVEDMIITATVVPDLFDKELQDSYGVKTPNDLLHELVDLPGEYDRLGEFVQKMNGYMLDEKVEQAKN